MPGGWWWGAVLLPLRPDLGVPPPLVVTTLGYNCSKASSSSPSWNSPQSWWRAGDWGDICCGWPLLRHPRRRSRLRGRRWSGGPCWARCWCGCGPRAIRFRYPGGRLKFLPPGPRPSPGRGVLMRNLLRSSASDESRSRQRSLPVEPWRELVPELRGPPLSMSSERGCGWGGWETPSHSPPRLSSSSANSSSLSGAGAAPSLSGSDSPRSPDPAHHKIRVPLNPLWLLSGYAIVNIQNVRPSKECCMPHKE